jgi:hypothetical protein
MQLKQPADPKIMTDKEYLNDLARSLGYSGAKPQPKLSGRGRKPVDLERLMADLFQLGYGFDRNFLEGTGRADSLPFFGDPHPNYEQFPLHLFRFTEAGEPHWLPRAEFIRYVRQQTHKLLKPVSYTAQLKKSREERRVRAVQARVASLEAQQALLETRRAELVLRDCSPLTQKGIKNKYLLDMVDLRIQSVKTQIHRLLTNPKALDPVNARKVELRRARRVVETGRPAKLPNGQTLEVEDAQWILSRTKIGRPMVSQPSRQTLYMRKYREKLRQQAQNPNPDPP